MKLSITITNLHVDVEVSDVVKNTDISIDWDDGSAFGTGKMPPSGPLTVSHDYGNELPRLVVARAANDDYAYRLLQLAQITAGDLETATTQGRMVISRTAAPLDGDRFTVTPTVPI